MADNHENSWASPGLGMASLENTRIILTNCLGLIEICRNVFISGLIKIFYYFFIYFKKFYKGQRFQVSVIRM